MGVDEVSIFHKWQKDWNLFVKDVLKANLDEEQQAIITSVQHNRMTAVASGTSRGKDFVAACAAMCFMYLTPVFDSQGNLVENTKIALTAPTGRQVKNIMTPEIRRLYRQAEVLHGRLVADDIRTEFEEWFLTGFKAGDKATEAWSGFHAANTMFVVTEASGISQETFDAIEGNLQGNSRLLIVFNPNVTTGYAANAMKSNRFAKFRLNSLNAPNVVSKKIIHSGQVDYEWVKDKVLSWCDVISDHNLINKGDGDFEFENKWYKPNDLFRIKVLGMFPTVSEDTLIPYEWIAIANENWAKLKEQGINVSGEPLSLGVDVAGMGRDSSVLVPRFGNYIPEYKIHDSGGRADHMHVVGMVVQYLKLHPDAKAYVDTIGEGAGVYSRLEELGWKDEAVSCKFGASAKDLSDVNGVYTFANLKAYLYWAVRDWLNPINKTGAAIPPNDLLLEEATNIKWRFLSNGNIAIESKDDLKIRLKRSPDYFDSLANTFYPKEIKRVSTITNEEILSRFR